MGSSHGDPAFPADDPSHAHALTPGTFDELYRSTVGALISFAQQLTRDPQAARDIVHDVFTNVWMHRAAWNPRESARAYLFRAVRNRAISHTRHMQVEDVTAQRLDPEAPPPGMAPPPPKTDALAIESDVQQRVRSAIDQLHERQRSAILLWWNDRLTLREIAEVLDISPPAALKLLSRAQARIVGLVGRKNLDPGG